MTTYEPLDRSLATLFAEDATAAAPHHLADRILAVTGRLRPRPAWRAHIHQVGWTRPGAAWADVSGQPGSRAWLLVALALLIVASVAVVGAFLLNRQPVLRGEFVSAGSLTTPATMAFLRPDGLILVVGGTYSAEHGLGSLHGETPEPILLYDLATGTSRETTRTRGGVSYAIPLGNGRLLAIGLDVPPGDVGGSSGASAANLIDPDAGTITPLGPTVGRHLFGAGVRLADGKVLLVGDAADATEAELFDPTTGTFSATGSTSRPMMQPTATLLADGRVLVVGDREPVAEIYDPATGTFSQTGPMSGPHEAFTATLLQDGRVLIAGGWATNGTVVDGTFIPSEPERLGSTVEIFDPATGQFAQVGPLITPRVHHFSVALADGRVLIGGGIGADRTEVLVAELFDPTFGTFTASGTLSTARLGAGAVVLPSGRVLVIGSVAEFGAITPTEELAASSLEVFE